MHVNPTEIRSVTLFNKTFSVALERNMIYGFDSACFSTIQPRVARYLQPGAETLPAHHLRQAWLIWESDL